MFEDLHKAERVVCIIKKTIIVILKCEWDTDCARAVNIVSVVN